MATAPTAPRSPVPIRAVGMAAPAEEELEPALVAEALAALLLAESLLERELRMADGLLVICSVISILL